MSNITVYTRNHCQACDATKDLLTRQGTPFTAINVQEHPEIAQQLVDEGWRAMPVVKTPTDAWAGMNKDKIQALA